MVWSNNPVFGVFFSLGQQIRSSAPHLEQETADFASSFPFSSVSATRKVGGGFLFQPRWPKSTFPDRVAIAHISFD